MLIKLHYFLIIKDKKWILFNVLIYYFKLITILIKIYNYINKYFFHQE